MLKSSGALIVLLLLLVQSWLTPLSCGSYNSYPPQRERVDWLLGSLPGLKVAEKTEECSASTIIRQFLSIESCATEEHRNNSANSHLVVTEGDVSATLTNSLNLSSFNRPTVVTPNPVASHPIQRTSTPFLSIPIPPEAPRNCVAIGQFVIPSSQLHSPNCSEVSSIGGSVFEEEDLEENIAFEMVNPEGSIDDQQLIDSIQLSMKKAEVVCKNKLSKFNRNLKLYPATDLSAETLEFHADKMKNMKLMFDDLTDHIDDYINNYSQAMSKENLSL